MSVFQRKWVVLLVSEKKIAQWHPRQKNNATFLWHTNHCKTWYLATFGDSPSWYLPAKKPRNRWKRFMFSCRISSWLRFFPQTATFFKDSGGQKSLVSNYTTEKKSSWKLVFSTNLQLQSQPVLNEWKMEMVKMLRKIPTISQFVTIWGSHYPGLQMNQVFRWQHLCDNQLTHPLSSIPASLKMSSLGLRGNSRLKTGGVAFASELTTWYSKQSCS